jgi:hypothetical protein
MSQPQTMSTGDPDGLARDAAEIAWLAHDDPATLHRRLDAADADRLRQLVATLAGMVDVDRTHAELLALAHRHAPAGTCRRCRHAPPSGPRSFYCDACRPAVRRAAWRTASARRRSLAAAPSDNDGPALTVADDTRHRIPGAVA